MGEDWYLHNPKPLQDQDPQEASHQGGEEDGLWSGDQGESKASEDDREGLPSRRAQVADLRVSSVWLNAVGVQRLVSRGNPTEQVCATHFLISCRMWPFRQ